MGTEDFKKFIDERSAMRACAGMLVVATPESIAALSEAATANCFPDMVTFPSRCDQPVPEQLAAAAQLLVVEVDRDVPQSIQRLIELGRQHPGVPVIAAIANASVPLVRTLVREGVSDVVSLPFQLEELLEVALSALTAARKKNASELHLAPMIAVVHSVGGCGVSTIATHLASDLAALVPAGRELAIVDLDLQSGSVQDYLGTTGRGSLADLLTANERLDIDLVRSMAHTALDNLAVFAAPPEIEPIEQVDTDQVLRLLTMMRQSYAGVVLDLPTDWTNWALSAASAADMIILVVELSVNSLRQAKRRLKLFDQVGIDPARVVVLVNRVERRMFKSVDLSDVDSTLAREVIGSLALEDPQLSSAQSQGLLVHAVSRKSKFQADISKVSADLATRLHLEAN